MTPKERILAQIRRSTVGGKRKKRLPRPPRPIPPYRIERMYASQLLAMRARLRELVREKFIPKLQHLSHNANKFYGRQKNDDFISEAFGDLDQVRVFFERQYTDKTLASIARNVFNETQQLNGDNIKRTFKSVLGIDIFINDTDLQNKADAFVFENVRFIKSANAKSFTDIENAVLDGFKSGKRWETIAAEIQSTSKSEALKDEDGNLLLDENGDQMYGKLSDWDAERIARDQVGKLNGELEQSRQTDLGVTSYIWRTSLDERVRPEHEILEGETFDWEGADVCPEGAPGTPIMCRCSAEPILDDLIN